MFFSQRCPPYHYEHLFTTYYIFVNQIVVITIRTRVFVLFFSGALTFDFTVVSYFFLCVNLTNGEARPTSKIIVSETRTVFVSYFFCLVFAEDYDKMKPFRYFFSSNCVYNKSNQTIYCKDFRETFRKFFNSCTGC